MRKVNCFRFITVLYLYMFVNCQGAKGEFSKSYSFYLDGGNQDGWIPLIVDNSTKGWHSYLGDNRTGWEVKDGVLFTTGKNGDIVTDQVFRDFELVLEWKIEEKGNSGVFINVVEDGVNKYMHETGPEFQIIDDLNYPVKLTDQQKTGALSDVLAPKNALPKVVGEWNTIRIIVDDRRVEYWLNGERILQFTLGSDELQKSIDQSKFKGLPYAKSMYGRIGLQDHGAPVYYRNIKIRKVNKDKN